MNKFYKWIILIVLLFIVFSFVFNKGSSNKTKNLEVEPTWINLSSEKETEIYYRFLEIYHDVQEKEGVEVLPKVGEKEWKTPKKDKAIQITAEEYSISAKQLKTVLENVEKTKPTDEEIRIFKIYDDKLNEAIDIEGAAGEKVDEEKIKVEVANSLGITPAKLGNIWTRVFAWEEDEKIKE